MDTTKWICENKNSNTSKHIRIITKKEKSEEYIKVKYGNSCPFNETPQLGSRGVTIIFENDKIKRESHAFWKFENYFNVEKLWGIAFEKLLPILEKQNYKFLYMPKYDGSCIQIFWHNNEFQAFTLGSVQENIMQSNISMSPTFKSAALKCLNNQYPELMEELKKNKHTLICELMTKYNRIVTNYKVDDIGIVKPLATIDQSGFPTWDLLGSVCDEFKNGYPSHCWDFTSKNWMSVKDKAYTDLESTIENPEGLVAYAFKKKNSKIIAIPIAKLKRDEYVKLHSGVILNRGSEKDCCLMQKMVVENKIDDVDLTNNPIAQKHIWVFNKKLNELQKMIDEYKDQLLNLTGKDFSIIVKKFDKNLTVILFTLKTFDKEELQKFDIRSWLCHENPRSQQKHTFIESFQNKNMYWFLTEEELIAFEKDNIPDEKEIDQLVEQIDNIIIFGCPLSTDIDVIVIKKDHHNGEPDPLSPIQLSFVKKELSDCKYDIINRELDIVLCCVDTKGRIIAMSKGGKFTPNIVMDTYHLHKQPKCHKKPYFVVLEINTIMIIESIRALFTFVMRHDDVLTQSTHDRKEKQKLCALNDHSYSISVINKISNSNINDKEYMSIMKSFTMKLIQLCEMSSGSTIHYTKEELCMSTIFTNDEQKQGALYWLLRGAKGKYNKDTITFLIEQFHKIYKQYTLEEMNFEYNVDDFKNPTPLSDELLDDFLNSPVFPSDDFEKKLNDETKNPDSLSLNHFFSTKADNKQIISKKYPKLPIEQFIFVDPRSKEWLEKLKYYTCGRNNATLEKEFQGYYNLIRGSIVEMLVANIYKYKDWDIINTGLIVEKDEKDAKGFAPDMVFVNDNGNKIVVVEIKSLRSGDKDSSYRRELHLAMNQLYGAKEILGKYCVLGIIIFGWIENKKLFTKVIEMDLD